MREAKEAKKLEEMEAAALREEEEEKERAEAAIKEVHNKLDALVIQDEEPKDISSQRITTEELKDSFKKSDTMRKSNKKKRNRKSNQ